MQDRQVIIENIKQLCLSLAMYYGDNIDIKISCYMPKKDAKVEIVIKNI